MNPSHRWTHCGEKGLANVAHRGLSNALVLAMFGRSDRVAQLAEQRTFNTLPLAAPSVFPHQHETVRASNGPACACLDRSGRLGPTVSPTVTMESPTPYRRCDTVRRRASTISRPTTQREETTAASTKKNPGSDHPCQPGRPTRCCRIKRVLSRGDAVARRHDAKKRPAGAAD